VTDAGDITLDAAVASPVSTDAASLADASAPSDAAVTALTRFSFFVTSLASLQQLSGRPEGFGGDLRFGETGPGAGLRGADQICANLAEASMPGAAQKGWHAFLSAAHASPSGGPVHAIDRIGNGPWYDRVGRLVAASKADLLHDRPLGADPVIIDDLPNERGIPNHNPDGQGELDNHDVLTGSDATGHLFMGADSATCADWTSAVGSAGTPRAGHSWIRNILGTGETGVSGKGWMSSLDLLGCAPGATQNELGTFTPGANSVGSASGYGAIYCFADRE
jgi:hypothetical protein